MHKTTALQEWYSYEFYIKLTDAVFQKPVYPFYGSSQSTYAIDDCIHK